MGNTVKQYDPWGYLKAANVKVERNRQIVVDYLAGGSLMTVGIKHGMSATNVANILRRAGIRMKRSGRR